MRELDSIAQPKMLLTEDFKSYSKLKVENHAFNRTSLPGHYKVKEYCPLVFRALRERFGVNEVTKTEFEWNINTKIKDKIIIINFSLYVPLQFSIFDELQLITL